MVPGGSPLVYSRRLARWRVIEPGKGGAYAVLFSEIGISLLITTLVGVLFGHWVDEQLGSLPIFLIVGFLIGAGSGTVMIYRLVSRFLKTID
jgi:ATP synthase protein I